MLACLSTTDCDGSSGRVPFISAIRSTCSRHRAPRGACNGGDASQTSNWGSDVSGRAESYRPPPHLNIAEHRRQSLEDEPPGRGVVASELSRTRPCATSATDTKGLARVAELADAPDLGSGGRKAVGVQIPPFAPRWHVGRRPAAHVRGREERRGALGPRQRPSRGVGQRPTKTCQAVGVQIPPFAPQAGVTRSSNLLRGR